MLKKTLILLTLCLIISVMSLKAGVLKFSLFNMSPDDYLVFYTIRLPRTILCWLLGPLLALSGAILQSITKNPLSSPDILGINAASSLAGLMTLVYFPGLPYSYLPLFTFAGGMIAFGLIFLLGRRMSPVSLALTGVAIHILFSSITSMVVSINSLQMQAALSWLTGSLWGKSWDHVTLAFIPTLIILGMVLLFARNLNLHQFSDDTMKNLGSRPNFSRLFFFIISVFCGSLAVGLMGPVGFVSLLSPQAARYLVGNDLKKVIPIASLIAVFWLLFADFLGRVILQPIEVPVGIITSIIGVPCFFFILSRFKRGIAQ
jgi:iron complex transport system permease protein